MNEVGVPVELMCHAILLMTHEVLAVTKKWPSIPLVTNEMWPVAAPRVSRAYTHAQPGVKSVSGPRRPRQKREGNGQEESEAEPCHSRSHPSRKLAESVPRIGRLEKCASTLAPQSPRGPKLLVQPEMSTLTEAQRETVLGELGAAVLHLHEHTRGLGTIIDSEG